MKQGRIFCCEYMDVCVAVKSGVRYARDPGGGGGGGGHSGIDGGRTHVTYFAESGLFLRPLHVRDFVKKKGYFLYPGTKYGG